MTFNQVKIKAVEQTLRDALTPVSQYSKVLYESMSYSVDAGGKRLRPYLCLLSYELFRNDIDRVLPIAAALEMIHTYSLIHDDLPALDNDDLRRGRPTNHKVYGEAIAILAGDGLLTYAFELTGRAVVQHKMSPEIIPILAMKAGPSGMVGGQTADMQGDKAQKDSELLDYIHNHKTADLIEASILCGAIAGGANQEDLTRLKVYAVNIGLAFQIADDILDETSTAEELGKSVGKDLEQGKLTYPALYGIEASRQKANTLVNGAVEALSYYGSKASELVELARFIVERKS